MSTGLRNSTNLRRNDGLKASNIPRLGIANKPRPLAISTNTIHSQKQLRPTTTKQEKTNKPEDNPVKKKVQTPHQESKPTQTPKVDENAEDPFVTDPYDPLQDIYPLDEELYQKVLKLELADDGLPPYMVDEPFDF